ncbi:hypothetical protein IKG24_02425 [Candidatus Saccharibacteria bacterium]|nr:hypothetical protein [Candidatus Saccharibacteria bacterium]
MKRKRGDTLIEVALAIGIFSLVAIVIVSVVSASTSGAQSSLELTLTREELDAQAEALRFIHDSYVSGSQSKDQEENAYSVLWNKITDHAYSDSTHTNPLTDAFDYNPQLCSGLYQTGPNLGYMNDNGGKQPFIINTRQIPNLKKGIDENGKIILSGTNSMRNIVDNIILSSGTSKVFFEPSTFPRLIYNDTPVTGNENESLYNQTEGNRSEILRRAEGIFIIVRSGKSQIIDGSSPDGPATPKSAYYDFYIRSCWMPVGSDRASTISTVVRLYDPAVICYGSTCSGS